MAANGARRRTLQLSSASAKTFLTNLTSATSKFNASSFSSKASTFVGLSSKPSSSNRFSLHKLSFSRLPVELGAAQSLMPMHSVTATALFTSLLSLHNRSWGCLSEGFATPL